MAHPPPIQGELQTQLMAVLWRLGSGTVEQARAALPARYRGAYTTVQTVLNRLVDRGLLARAKSGTAYVYRPAISEADYFSRSVEQTLAHASGGARQAVLAQLVGSLDAEEVEDLHRLGQEIAASRAKRRRPR